MIVAAAIEHDGLIITLPRPSRHHHILHKMHDIYHMEKELEQGFIDNNGVFYTREAAYKHCQVHNQSLTRRIDLLESGQNVYNGNELFSEDLW